MTQRGHPEIQKPTAAVLVILGRDGSPLPFSTCILYHYNLEHSANSSSSCADPDSCCEVLNVKIDKGKARNKESLRQCLDRHGGCAKQNFAREMRQVKAFRLVSVSTLSKMGGLATELRYSSG